MHGGAVAAVAELLGSARLMALGVNRPDGWPQVTTIGYVNDGLKLYFVIARDSQKFRNIQADPRVSVAIRPEGAEADTVGVSLAGRAVEVTDAVEVERLNKLVFERYPDARAFCPSGSSVAVMRLSPEIVAPVAVIGGRSRAETYAIGPGGAPPASPGAGQGVSRLF
ncbi:MAG: pyridoxamine 5'-phosphate oxidase family protein [Alphaproteobacteria bacterium]|nr:pyridoxamine 5'-phosphate oxidase family protein [Brevundimonas sp.]MBU3969751.1 pyridoxamine 5'-phosphate oxidase family protein [Alphaproteobacteria bacterium]MBU3975032.1 pyridoxamine 5'-phosphate oxidase family protein [Alphaproteobacteria bacterium]